MKTRTIYRAVRGEYEEKKSRFIADLFYVTTPEEAEQKLAAVRKEFYDARHHCSAYILRERENDTSGHGPNPSAGRLIMHASDDGEPQGTAGRPMLDLLASESIVDCIAIVTRYFGGTLLGTGGLVRSYTKALQDALQKSEIIERQRGIPVTVRVGYETVGKMEYYTASNRIAVLEKTYGSDAGFTLLAPEEEKDRIIKALTEMTSGRVRPSLGDPVEYAVHAGRVLTGEARLHGMP